MDGGDRFLFSSWLLATLVDPGLKVLHSVRGCVARGW